MEHAALSIEDRPLARKRIGVVLLVFASRLAFASLLAMPFAVLLGRAVGAYPRGDAVLFDPGGLLFIEALRRTRDALPPLGAGALLLFVVFCLLGLLPLGAMLGALGVKGRLSARDLGAFALRPIGVFSLLLGVFAVVQALAFGIVVAIGRAVARRGSFDTRDADLVKLAFVGVALLVVLLLGVLHDLARASAVRRELGLRASIRAALGTVRRAPVVVFGAWAWRSALGLVALASALVIGSRLGIDRGGQVALGFLVHQGSVLVALGLRASWLAAALGHVDASLAPKADDEDKTEPAAEPSVQPDPAAEESPLPVDDAPKPEVPSEVLPDEKVEHQDGLSA